MSRLQTIINSLAQVILDYGVSQRLKTESLKVLLKKPHLEFIEALQTVINDGTKDYVKRLSLLNYLLFEIKQLKPLVDRDIPLREEERLLVQQHLQALIVNIQLLLRTSQSTEVPITYNKKEERIPGFMRGIMEGYYPCNSGHIIEKAFLKPLQLSDYEPATVSSFVEELLKEHQQEIAIPFLSKENALLTSRIVDLQETNASLVKEKLSLESQKQEGINSIEALTHENEQLRKTAKTLEGENKEILLTQEAILKEKAELEKEVGVLKKEIQALRLKPAQVRTYPHPLAYSFFGGMNGLTSLMPSILDEESKKSTSPSFGSPLDPDE
ncbi:alanine--tRNA ligase [Legionella hackeliae]|uniref:Uncharacterized protein n=1 Tax=Legionella hackeliae TaxID=449 RepID=A0A0A8UQS0_LEGHA|nr:hypothetical protein [Legionella hackeliae]KTD15435.1 hypothetical protein Lhac_0277 [Legionella hackeliae]CEK11195.1 protein of unknown function [Legionella hackeliae]STX47960.1 Uncharacterised protein [Legionella hackeliae]